MIVVNGQRQPPASNVAELVERLGMGGRGVAVAVDGEVVPRSQWAAWVLADGVRVEVVGAVQGG